MTGNDVLEALEKHYLDPIDVTYFILRGEVPSDRIPLVKKGKSRRFNFTALQSQSPKLENYFPDRATLDLFNTVHDKVKAAIRRATMARNPLRTILFPL